MADEQSVTEVGAAAPPTTDGHAMATSAVRFCSKCLKDVVPIGKGQCPDCGTFLPGHTAARKHPVRLAVRAKLLAELCDQFPPQDLVQTAERQQLAAALERLETLTPGTPEWGRLIASASTLGAAIRAEEAARTEVVAADTADLSPVELLRRARGTVERLEQLVALTDAAASPSEAPLVRGNAIAPQPEPSPASDQIAPGAQSSSVLAENDTPPQAVPENAACIYCRQPLDRCAEIRLTDLPRWRVLHAHDPAEHKRLDAEATAVMHGQVGKPSPWR